VKRTIAALLLAGILAGCSAYPRRVVVIALLFAVLIAGDFATTMYGLSIGGVEGNPLTAFVPFGWAGAIALKGVIATVFIFFMIRRFEPGDEWAAIPGAVALALPVSFNLIQIASR
jgi:hypothetical protein